MKYCTDYWRRQRERLTLRFLNFQSELGLEHYTNRIKSMERGIHGSTGKELELNPESFNELKLPLSS